MTVIPIRGSGSLEASSVAVDSAQIEAFALALLCYASEGVNVSLRAFYDGTNESFGIRGAKVNGSGVAGVVPAAVRLATEAAAADRGVVFCPPIAGFSHSWRATQDDLVEAYALSVECDANPVAARSTLEELLGPATVVVQSGGEWTNPSTGEAERKLHLHWRLTEPATGDDRDRLKAARRNAAVIVGGDPSNVPSVHPIRWPGSVHRKGAPRLAQILELNEHVEIDLGEAAERLAERAQAVWRPSIARQDAGPAGKAADGEYQTLFANVLRGDLLHDSIARLASKMIASGMVPGAAVLALRGMMEASAAPRDARWTDRFDDIPRAVSTAEAKYRRESVAPGHADPTAGAAEDDFEPTGFIGDVPPPRPWAYGDFLMEGAVTGIAAPPGVGKTTFSFQLGLAFGLNMDFGPWTPRPGGGGRVWLYNGEEPMDELTRRFLAACKAMGVQERPAADRLRFNSGLRRAFSLGQQDKNGAFVRSPDVDRIKARIKAGGFKLFIVDPLIEFHGAKENDTEAFGRVGAVCREIANDCGCAVLVFHHTPKAANADTSAGDMNALRGGGALIGVARFVLTMFSMTAADAQKFGVAEAERPSFVRFDSAKANMAPVTGGATWWRKLGVSIENGDNDRPADNVGVLSPAHLQSTKPDPAQLAAQRAELTEGDLERLAREVVRICLANGHTSESTAIALTPLSEAVDHDAIRMKARKAWGLMSGKMGRGFELEGWRIVMTHSHRGKAFLQRIHVEGGAEHA